MKRERKRERETERERETDSEREREREREREKRERERLTGHAFSLILYSMEINHAGVIDFFCGLILFYLYVESGWRERGGKGG